MKKWLCYGLLLAAWSLMGASSCGKKEVAGPTPTPTNTPTPTPLPGSGVVNDNLGFTLALASTTDFEYWLHEGTTSFTSPCTITATSTNKDITCYLEVNELDLWFNGVSIGLNVPTSVCSYLLNQNYWYYQNPAGNGPDYFKYYIDQNGNKGWDTDENGVIDNTTPQVRYGGAGGSDAGGAARGGMSGFTPYCNFNYASSDGPNCCEGTYTVVTETWIPATYDEATPPNVVVAAHYQEDVYADSSWGGSYASCVTGAGMQLASAKTDEGYPKMDIYSVQEVGLSKTLTISSPYSMGAGNYFVANYYASSVPAVLTAEMPEVAADTYHVPPAYYTFQCLDEDFETTARIRLRIREWNTLDEFQKGVLGNSDEVGTETDFGGGDNNDFPDLDDLGSSYP